MAYPQATAARRRFRRLAAGMPAADRRRLRAACALAERLHRGQLKFGLYPYIIHPLAVCDFLAAELGRRDPDLLIAALLHDTVEDCGLEPGEIERRFGPRVGEIVRTVTRRPAGPEGERDKARRKMKFFREVVCRGCPEAQLLGIADKYDNIRRAPLIPRSSPHRPKWRRWVREAEAFLELAEQTAPEAGRHLAAAVAVLRRKIDEDAR